MPHDDPRYPPPVSVLRHLSGPDALPTGHRRTHDRRHAIGTATPVGLVDRGAELYRMRTQSHLYEERDVEVALDLERTIAHRMGLLLADCHECKATMHIEPDTDTCPACGKEL